VDENNIMGINQYSITDSINNENIVQSMPEQDEKIEEGMINSILFLLHHHKVK